MVDLIDELVGLIAVGLLILVALALKEVYKSMLSYLAAKFAPTTNGDIGDKIDRLDVKVDQALEYAERNYDIVEDLGDRVDAQSEIIYEAHKDDVHDAGALADDLDHDRRASEHFSDD